MSTNEEEEDDDEYKDYLTHCLKNIQSIDLNPQYTMEEIELAQLDIAMQINMIELLKNTHPPEP